MWVQLGMAAIGGLVKIIDSDNKAAVQKRKDTLKYGIGGTVVLAGIAALHHVLTSNSATEVSTSYGSIKTVKNGNAPNALESGQNDIKQLPNEWDENDFSGV